jgi:hypothetical protein
MPDHDDTTTPAGAPSAAATGDLRPGGVSGMRVRPARERPPRRPLVARWVPIATISVVGAVVLAVVIFTLAVTVGKVATPKVTGMELGVARVALERAGFTAQVAEERFSDLPAGTVLEQRPAAGVQVRRGSAVALVVSGGTDEFAMPDVIGDGLTLAQGTLEGKGLVVRIERQISDAASDTVLSSVPGPGALVRTGDIVRLTVAGTGTVSGLGSYQLDGLSIALDPVPVSPGQLDVSMDVARRLQSLLQAAGANVLMTRSSAETNVPSNTRALRVAESSATVLVVVQADPSGAPGLSIQSESSGDPAYVTRASALASAVASALAGPGVSVPVSTTVPDAVMMAVRGPAFRVRLGSLAVKEDEARFRDPQWADGIARAVYRGIGQVLGTAR